jgi:hypothetical protein
MDGWTYLVSRRCSLALAFGKRRRGVVLIIRVVQGVLVMVRRRGGAHVDLGNAKRGIQSDACAFSIRFLGKKRNVRFWKPRWERRTYQSLHHLCGRLEVEVETQVLTRVGFGDLERFRELGLDGGGDFVDRVQEALDLERGLRIGRTIMYLDEKLSH